MKGLMTKIKMENNQNDMTIDFSVDTFQIKDSEKRKGREEAENHQHYNHSKMNRNIQKGGEKTKEEERREEDKRQ
jgi:hypothetical protein